jgi:hypothetical protein
MTKLINLPVIVVEQELGRLPEAGVPDLLKISIRHLL